MYQRTEPPSIGLNLKRSVRFPELPGSNAILDFIEFLLHFNGIPSIVEIVPLEFASLISAGEWPVLLGEPDTFAMHGEETGYQRAIRILTVIILNPETSADKGCIAEFHIRFTRMPDAQEESREGFVGTALGNEPANLILDIFADGLKIGDPAPVRLGGVIDQGRNHPDLSFLGPGDKRVLFAWHKTQQYYERTYRVPGPSGHNIPRQGLWAFARISKYCVLNTYISG